MTRIEGWESIALGAAGRWLSGGTPSTKEPEFWGGDIPWISSGSLTNFRVEDADRRVTELGARNGTRLVGQGAILIVVRGMSLKTEVRLGITQREVAFGQDCKALVVADGIDAEFLAYAMATKRPELLGLVDEAGHGTGRLNTDQLYAVQVPMPGLSEQRAIAEVLGALDDKIAANERTLLKVVQLDDLDVTDMIQRSSSGMRLDQCATVTKGVSYRSVDLAESSTALVTLKSIDRKGLFAERGFKPFRGEYRQDQAVARGDIIVAQTDLTQGAEVIGWAVRVPEVPEYTQLVATLDLAIVRPGSEVPAGYLLGALRQRRFRTHCQARMSGTTVLHLGRGAIESFEVPLLERAAMDGYSDRARQRHDLVDAVRCENKLITRARDELLPLLMSGKVRVKDAEKIVEEVV